MDEYKAINLNIMKLIHFLILYEEDEVDEVDVDEDEEVLVEDTIFSEFIEAKNNPNNA